MATTTQTQATPSKIFNLLKDYFVNSDEKLVAWLLLIGTALCVIALVAIMTGLAWWTAGFWALLIAKAALTPFLISLGEFGLLAGAYIAVSVLKNYLIGELGILWCNWLTKKIIIELFGSVNNFLDLKRFSSAIDNIGQRIQEDVKNFVDGILNLGANFLKSVLSLGAFAGTLWVVGGPLSFVLFGLNIMIPGYLVWVALIAAVAATAITHGIGKLLPKMTQKVEHAEADLRQDLAQLNLEAEGIAEEHAEDYYKASLAHNINRVKKRTNQKLITQTKMLAFQSFYYQSAAIIPLLFSAPLYFTGLIAMGQLMQISMAFGEVGLALSMFVEGYESIANCRASIERIVALRNAFEKDGLPAANPKLIVRNERQKESINVKNLNVMTPQVSSANYIMRGLNVKFNAGEHVLIKGPSGMGKSTLFKVISGSWKYGEGKVAVPAGKHIYFLPQMPILPHDTLQAVLAYPEPAHHYTKRQYIEALKAVGGMTAFIKRLGEKRHWSKELSGGQQQRISFARALLKKPDWLFLDEATSSLDEESENHVYQTLKEKLTNTTIVSIGHRSTIEKHHAKILFFNPNKEKEMHVSTTLRPVQS